jgi:two-component sensor histidine kinase
MPEKSLLQLQVALDEIVSNVIRYAWPEAGAHEIEIRTTVRDDGVEVEIIDDGRMFDPRNAPKRDKPLHCLTSAAFRMLLVTTDEAERNAARVVLVRSRVPGTRAVRKWAVCSSATAEPAASMMTPVKLPTAPCADAAPGQEPAAPKDGFDISASSLVR